MQTFRLAAIAVACFAAGALSHAGLAQGKKLTYDAAMLQGTPEEVGARFLDGALQLAEQGSWERIAVGRAWYLGGDKAKGQQIFDEVTSSRKVEGSDFFRIARVYVEAGEWPKARETFDKAIAKNADDDTGTIEYGGYANLNKDRAKAEALFKVALQKKPKEFWHWVNVGGSYLGVKPQ
jgi:tetratricopeptide (TPR) repeat protein